MEDVHEDTIFAKRWVDSMDNSVSYPDLDIDLDKEMIGGKKPILQRRRAR